MFEFDGGADTDGWVLCVSGDTRVAVGVVGGVVAEGCGVGGRGGGAEVAGSVAVSCDCGCASADDETDEFGRCECARGVGACYGSVFEGDVSYAEVEDEGEAEGGAEGSRGEG